MGQEPGRGGGGGTGADPQAGTSLGIAKKQKQKPVWLEHPVRSGWEGYVGRDKDSEAGGA